MPRRLTLDIPDEVERALQNEAARTGKSPEEVALDWIGSHVESPVRGSADALMLSHGAWSMTPAKRTQIERMIDEEPLLGEQHARS